MLGWIFAILFSLSVTAQADTMLDGYWEINPSLGLSCLNGSTPNPEHVAAFFEKYEPQHMHLSDLQLTKYWITPQGDPIVSPVFIMKEIVSNQHYLLQHVPLSIPDAELFLIQDPQDSYIEYRTIDHDEWNLCNGTTFQIFFKYLRLNP